MEEVLQQSDNKQSKRNQMSIETVSVEQTTRSMMELKLKGEMRWGNWFEVSCGLGGLPLAVVTPFGRHAGLVQPPHRGGVAFWGGCT